MTTVGDAIKEALYDNWAGSGGTRPAIYSTEDESMWPSDDDWIMMLGWTFVEKEKPRNDAFKGVKHYIDMRVHSRNDANKEERLDTIVTEIKRIVIPDNVTGYNQVRIIDQNRRASDRRIHSYIAEMTVELILLSTSSAVTPGTGGDGDVVFPADVDIAGDLDVTGDITGSGTIEISDDQDIVAKIGRAAIGYAAHGDAAVFAHRDQTLAGNYGLLHGSSGQTLINSRTGQPIQFRQNNVLIASLEQIADACMIGSANAAWVPMTFEVTYASTVQVRGESSQIANVDGLSDGFWMFNLAQPTVKGGLKLYISGLRLVVLDADADDYVTNVFLTGVGDSNNTILNDATDRTAADTYDYTFTAEDMSAAHTVRALIQTVNTDATDLNIGTVSCRCYYAA